jgi:hypothetical protein
MRFPRLTVEIVLILSLGLIGIEYLSILFPEQEFPFHRPGLDQFARIAFYGFSLDYLTRKDSFFKTKYYGILLFGIGLLFISPILNIMQVNYTSYLFLLSVVLIPFPYVVWTLGLTKFKLMPVIKSGLGVLTLVSSFSKILHLRYSDWLNLLLFLAFVFALTFQWFYLRNKLPKSVS